MDEGESIGAIATGSLLAAEVERARRGAPAVGHDPHEACANCGVERLGAYCHACGQAGHVHRNLGALVHDVAHGVFHFEGKIWRTLPLLIRHPGELTRRYVAGERTRFVSPMALFLFSVFLMFAVVSNGGGGHKAAVTGKATGEVGRAAVKLADLRARRDTATDAAARARLDEAVRAQEIEVRILANLARTGVDVGTVPKAAGADAALGDFNTGWAWFDEKSTKAAKNPDLLIYKLKNYAYKYSWALIPISVPFIWLLFPRRRDVGFYDHAIFAIYSIAFMSLGVVVLVVLGRIGVVPGVITLAGFVLAPIHMYRQLKGAYGLGRAGALWRTALLLVFTGITMSLFSSFVLYMGSG